MADEPDELSERLDVADPGEEARARARALLAALDERQAAQAEAEADMLRRVAAGDLAAVHALKIPPIKLHREAEEVLHQAEATVRRDFSARESGFKATAGRKSHPEADAISETIPPADQQARWDRWNAWADGRADARIAAALDELAKEMAKAVADVERDLVARLVAENKALAARLEALEEHVTRPRPR